MQKCLGVIALLCLVSSCGAIMSCNNGCGNDTKSYCGGRRWNPDGTVESCVDVTRYGYACYSSCSKGEESYYWCYTSWHIHKMWEYCAPPNKTIYGSRCASECAKRGKDYWWCYTTQDRGLTGKWDYCAPPSEVQSKRVTYTISGQECITDCAKDGQKYWWCRKSQRWPSESGGGGRTRDSWWDYCSPQDRTRYNKPCKDACASRGEDYFWCKTIDNSWGYCSPKAPAKPVIGNSGRECVGICDKMDWTYKFCAVMNVGHSRYWSDSCGEGYKGGTSSLNQISLRQLLSTLALASAVQFSFI